MCFFTPGRPCRSFACLSAASQLVPPSGLPSTALLIFETSVVKFCLREAFVLGYHTINVSTGTETSINELIESFEKAVGHAVPVDYKEARTGDILRSVLSNKALESLLSFVPPTDLAEGIRRTYEWYCRAAAK